MLLQKLGKERDSKHSTYYLFFWTSLGPWTQPQKTKAAVTLCRKWKWRLHNSSWLNIELHGFTPKLQYFGHLMQRVDSLEKTLMLGGIGGKEEKGMTEDEMAGWHHWLDDCESQWTLGVGDGQGGLACWDSRGHKESDTTERLNWTELTPRHETDEAVYPVC